MSKRSISKRATSRGEDEAQLFELNLPKTCSTVTSGQHSLQWAKGVLQDIETAAAEEHTDQMYM